MQFFRFGGALVRLKRSQKKPSKIAKFDAKRAFWGFEQVFSSKFTMIEIQRVAAVNTNLELLKPVVIWLPSGAGFYLDAAPASTSSLQPSGFISVCVLYLCWIWASYPPFSPRKHMNNLCYQRINNSWIKATFPPSFPPSHGATGPWMPPNLPKSAEGDSRQTWAPPKHIPGCSSSPGWINSARWINSSNPAGRIPGAGGLKGQQGCGNGPPSGAELKEWAPKGWGG